ncbi:MAG TPA: ACP S-malonyltransferase, partial [Bacillota bacterium]
MTDPSHGPAGGGGGGIALMFAGQGAQYVGMGRELYDRYEAARAVFAEAEEASELPLRRLCFEGPEGRLAETEITQPAVLTVGVAALRCLEAELERPLPVTAAAGLSLGEYTALVAAGVLSLGEAARLVRFRGRCMQEAVPLGVGSMAAVMGLDAGVLEDLCRRVSTQETCVEPANYNCPGQVVVAGHAPAVRRLVEAARAAGARRVVELAVSAPFHCRLMEPASRRFAPALAGVPMADARVPVVNNVDGVARTAADDLREALLAQVDHPVRWEACVATMRGLEPALWLELGPGTTLSGFLRRIDRGLRSVSVEDAASLAAAVA